MANKLKEMAQNAMVRGLSVLMFLVFGLVAQAAENDALVAFSTRGPDAYADGTPVQEGEVYALVWSRTGFDFAGVDLNGQAIDTNNNEIVVARGLGEYSRRRGGVRCPYTLFQLDATFAATHANGTFSLVLFDTRKSDGKGGFTVGDASHVQGWGVVENSRVKAVASTVASAANAGEETGTKTVAQSAIPAGTEIPRPRITGISVADGYVTLTVTGTDERLLYNVASGAEPGRHDRGHAAQSAVAGHASHERAIKLVVPVEAGQQFFQVVRN